MVSSGTTTKKIPKMIYSLKTLREWKRYSTKCSVNAKK